MVAERVVDLLEPVEVEQQQARPAGRCGSARLMAASVRRRSSSRFGSPVSGSWLARLWLRSACSRRRRDALRHQPEEREPEDREPAEQRRRHRPGLVADVALDRTPRHERLQDGLAWHSAEVDVGRDDLQHRADVCDDLVQSWVGSRIGAGDQSVCVWPGERRSKLASAGAACSCVLSGDGGVDDLALPAFHTTRPTSRLEWMLGVDHQVAELACDIAVVGKLRLSKMRQRVERRRLGIADQPHGFVDIARRMRSALQLPSATPSIATNAALSRPNRVLSESRRIHRSADGRLRTRSSRHQDAES